MFLKGMIKRMLVVAPLSIVSVWEQEFEKFADFDYSLTVLDGGAAKKSQMLKYARSEGLEVVVVNYESAWRMEAELVRWKADFIVCDESTKIKNPQAKCSKAMHRLGKASKYNAILIGTPVVNNPLDFFSQFKFLDESIFGGSYYSFRAKYAILGGFQNHQIVGYKNLAELVEKAHSIAYRVKIADAVDLPQRIDEVRVVALEASAQSIYKSIEKDSYAELMNGEISTRNILTKLLRLSQVTGGFVRSDDGDDVQAVSSAKLAALEDIIDTCADEGKKVVVFARFLPEIYAIERLLKKKGLDYSLIYGEVKDRAEQIRRFQEDNRVRVFIGQLATVSMGLTLTAAHVAVFYSLDFNYSNYEQSKARIHRIGQKEKCLYIHLVAKDTVDETIMSALKHKRDVATLIVDDYKKILGGK
jgi:SNF2 family DNA or RNA helicase